MKANPEILIVGPGAIGLTVAKLLGAQRVLLLSRDTRLWRVSFREAEFYMEDAMSLQRSKVYDLIFVTVKAYDIESAVMQLMKQNLVKKGSKIVVLANGFIDPLLQELSGQYPEMCWGMGLVYFGAYREGSHHLYCISADLKKIKYAFLNLDTKLNLGLTYSDNIIWESRRKWAFNVAINSLTVLYQLERNGDLIKFHKQVDGLLGEAYAFIKDHYGPWPWRYDELKHQIWQLISETAANRNSMVSDHKAARRTERLFLTGVVTDQQRYPLITQIDEELQALVGK